MATAEQKREWRKRWKNEKIKQGLCSRCGKEPLVSTAYGLRCLRQIRNYSRKKYGLVGWRPGKRGPVPYEHRPGPVNFPQNFGRGFRLVRVNQDGLTAWYRSTASQNKIKGVWVTLRVEKTEAEPRKRLHG
jgi:hypothetical protein